MITRHTEAQLRILLLGQSVNQKRLDKRISKEAKQEKSKSVKAPKKPLKEMTSEEYLIYLKQAGL